MNDDLLKRLREPCFEIGLDEMWIDDQRNKAADRIDAQSATIKSLVEALEFADAALSGANMNIGVVERKVRAAIAAAKETT